MCLQSKASHSAPGMAWRLRFKPACIFERQITVPVAAS
jgi:hypothetical protein